MRRPPSHAAAIRRRRLTTAGTLIALGLAVIVLVSSGSSGSPPKYVPSAGGVASVITAAPPTRSRSDPPPRTAFTPAPPASALAARLSLEQQVAQLFLVSLDGQSAAAVSGLGKLNWAGVVFDATNFQSDGQVSALAGEVVASARAAGNVPPLLAATQAGGPGTAFRDLPPLSEPTVAGAGASTTAATEATRAGKRLHALGFNMTLAPNVDVDTPGGALSGRLFSSDPSTVARFGLAALSGYAATRTIAAPGHFPGEGGASADPNAMTATVGGSLAQLRTRDLIPFVAIAPRAPVIVMSNAVYAAFDGVTPASLLGAAVTLLRTSFNFQGVS